MAEAAFSVSFAGPLVTLQDGGRPGNLRYGVAASGPMDRLAFEAANAALGNAAGRTGIEVSPGGLILQCTGGAVTLAIAGGDFTVQHGSQKTRSWTVLTVRKGERLAITAGRTGSWAYLAFSGRIAAPGWLGSQATHSTSGFGGGALRSGQTLSLTDATVQEERLGDIPRPDIAGSGPFRVVIGPQERHFAASALERFLGEPYAVTEAFDRMGMRLKGPELPLAAALSIPSEPILRGSVQVSGDGVPTVLMADHQTTGGYPKIATVISPDTDRLAQCRPGQSVRFRAITASEAVAAARDHAAAKAACLARIAVPRGTLAQRLMRENLIHGWAPDDGVRP